MACCGSGYLNRRIADRGNDGGALDLFDHEVEQPQRLAWLTPGLGAVEWVERLQHLVPGLGLVSSSLGKETEPVKTVRDELTGNEEHPPNGDIIYDYPSAYDEYEDEEWYYWMTGAGVTYDSTGYVTNSLLSLKGRRILAVNSSLPCFDCYEDYWCVTRALNVIVVQEEGTVQEEITGSRLECVKVSEPVEPNKEVSMKTELDDDTTKFDGQIRGMDYVFDPGGWFLKLSKLEDEFFSKRRRMMRIDMDQFELKSC